MKVLSVISALAVVAFVIFGWGTAIAEGGFKVVVNAVGIAGAFLLAVAVIFCLFFLVDAIASTVERALDVEPAPTLASRSILAVELGDSFFLEHRSDGAEGSGVVFESWNTENAMETHVVNTINQHRWHINQTDQNHVQAQPPRYQTFAFRLCGH